MKNYYIGHSAAPAPSIKLDEGYAQGSIFSVVVIANPGSMLTMQNTFQGLSEPIDIA